MSGVSRLTNRRRSAAEVPRRNHSKVIEKLRNRVYTRLTVLVPEAATMKEPGRAPAATVLVAPGKEAQYEKARSAL